MFEHTQECLCVQKHQAGLVHSSDMGTGEGHVLPLWLRCHCHLMGSTTSPAPPQCVQDSSTPARAHPSPRRGDGCRDKAEGSAPKGPRGMRSSSSCISQDLSPPLPQVSEQTELVLPTSPQLLHPAPAAAPSIECLLEVYTSIHMEKIYSFESFFISCNTTEQSRAGFVN